MVLDIHAGGNEGAFPLCTSFHPIPDPAQRAEIARVAQLFDTSFINVYSGELGSGLLTDEAEAERKVTLGGEFGFGESVNAKGVLHAYEGTRSVLCHSRMLPGGVVNINSSRAAPPRFVAAKHLSDYIPCPKDGIWEPAAGLGVDVRQGELLGCLHDFSDHSLPLLEIRADRSGALINDASCRRVQDRSDALRDCPRGPNGNWGAS